MPRKKAAKQKINYGSFNGNIYAKHVEFSKAVLWKDRQLSIPKHVFIGLQAHSTTEMRFIDYKKGEMWVFDPDMVRSFGTWKTEGQEEQYYFPIELAKIVEIKKQESETA